MNRTYPGPKIDTKGIIYVGLHPLASQDEIFEVTIFKSTGKTSNSRETQPNKGCKINKPKLKKAKTRKRGNVDLAEGMQLAKVFGCDRNQILKFEKEEKNGNIKQQDRTIG